MKNTDLIIADNMIYLGKVYPVRYSMRSIYRMECRYGSVDAALERLRHYENIGVFLDDFAYILSTMIKSDERTIHERLNAENLPQIFEVVMKTISEHSVRSTRQSAVRAERDDGMDWDSLIFFARQRLRWSEGEFWSATPRKLYKAMDLYIGKKPGKSEQEIIQRLNAAGL